ncbi:MAG TPA: PD-(D/E)XK nuclease family protein [Bryobacteraceae bacterium]|nr:PD-(D/E)XK nuclease family protein [Bryobacteraceae bacterium]
MHRYSDLRRRAVDFVTQFSAGGPVLVLAPVRAAAEETALEACGKALSGVRRLAFREYVMDLAAPELNRRQLVPVGRFVREALAARVTAEALNDLTYLRPVATFPGFPRALTATFEELRLNAVDPERLRACGESGPDLAGLLTAYTRELTERRFADHAARVDLARDVFSAGYNTLRQTAVVALDLVPRTRLERELLASVMGAARVALELRLVPDTAEPATSLDSLQRYLFSSEPVPPREDDASVVILSTSGEALECVEIARAIHAAAAEGVPFDQIAILLRSPERHQPLILEALRRAGIPSYSALAIRRPDVSGRALLALLSCAAEKLSASRFAEYLSLGQMPVEDEPPTPALWERLLVDAAVIGGLPRWETRLAGLREEFHRRHAAEEDEQARESLGRRIEAVENLTRLALPVIARLAALPARAPWGEWIDALAALAEFTLRDPAHVIGLLEELEPMSDIGPVSLNEVLMVVGPRLNSLAAAPRESRFGRVWVGSVEETRGLAFRRVFVPGVNEGLFPRPPAEDPLLLHGQRKALGDIELRADDTELLRIAAACASERLTLSFSRLDLLTGRERVPSFYAFEAHRAAGGREMGVREFDDRARSKTTSRIGWPAPPDAAKAIDDAEFDLATLAPLGKGSGHYLKSLPGRSVDSLRARWARWHKPWKAADGVVIEEIGSQATAPYLLSARAWSPSVLQQYARCPYRFALRGIHGLRPEGQPAGIQRMDPATRGEIYHAAQFELLRDLAGSALLPINADNVATALDRLDDVLQQVAERFEADLAPAIPQIWRAEIQAIRADLRGWLQQRAALEPDWTPQFYELSFGLRDPVGRDPRSRKEPVEIEGGFRLQGSIDLVERHSSGVLRVVDHKTGRVPEPRPEMVGSGEVLQPALYALAAEQILGERVAFGRLYYSTIAQNYTAIDVHIDDWSRRRASQVLHVIDDAMRSGFLPAAPRKDGCKRCEYLPVCGPYEEERAGEKSQPELKALKEVRTWR